MDTVLSQFILEDMLEINAGEDFYCNDENLEMSMWVKDHDLIRSTTDITLLKKIPPGIYAADANRDIGYFCRKLESSTDELFLFSDSITTSLLKEINSFWDKQDLYKANNLIHKRGILLEGFPGTGKSSIIALLCQEVIKRGGVVFNVTSAKNLGEYLAFIRTGFRKIQPETPIITILEDIDHYEDAEPELLDFLDGKTHIEHHVVIATTNNTENVPDTFLRPSRLDLKVIIDLPNEIVRREYFNFKNVNSDLVDHLVSMTKGCSLADLKEIYICHFLLDYNIEEAISQVITPREKRNYLHNSSNFKNIGFK